MNTTETEFDRIVAALDVSLPCYKCRRPARWMADCHSHGHEPMCTWHKNRCLKSYAEELAEHGDVLAGCGLYFATVEDCITFRPI